MSKVIVIDDEPFILMMIEDKLRKAKIDVLTLRESKNALDVIRREKPSLVILDWMMPELSGIELCKKIKSDSDLSSIPVFMLTAKGQDSDEQLGLQSGGHQIYNQAVQPEITSGNGAGDDWNDIIFKKTCLLLFRSFPEFMRSCLSFTGFPRFIPVSASTVFVPGSWMRP